MLNSISNERALHGPVIGKANAENDLSKMVSSNKINDLVVRVTSGEAEAKMTQL